MSAHSATLKLDNQKNGWKGVCIHQEHNGKELACPVRALGRRYLHIRLHTSDPTTFLSSYFSEKRHYDVSDRNISAALKMAALVLAYPSRGFPIERIDTHSLRSGGGECLIAGWVLRSPNSENGAMERRNFQRVHPRRVACFLGRHVTRHETKVPIC